MAGRPKKADAGEVAKSPAKVEAGVKKRGRGRPPGKGKAKKGKSPKKGGKSGGRGRPAKKPAAEEPAASGEEGDAE